MHEFSIAVNIVEIVEQNVEKENGHEVKNVRIEAGQFSGVVIEALEQALHQAKKDTIASKAEFIIKEITGKLRCTECKFEFEACEMYTPCPKCQNIFTDIIGGNELKVKSIEII